MDKLHPIVLRWSFIKSSTLLNLTYGVNVIGWFVVHRVRSCSHWLWLISLKHTVSMNTVINTNSSKRYFYCTPSTRPVPQYTVSHRILCKMSELKCVLILHLILKSCPHWQHHQAPKFRRAERQRRCCLARRQSVAGEGDNLSATVCHRDNDLLPATVTNCCHCGWAIKVEVHHKFQVQLEVYSTVNLVQQQTRLCHWSFDLSGLEHTV